MAGKDDTVKDERAAPLSDWSDDGASIEPVVYRSRLDKRFLVEVVRLADSSAALRVFDHTEGDMLLLNEPTGLTFGAAFGADVADVVAWQHRVLEVVDAIPGYEPPARQDGHAEDR
jgi:hypothetical protein